MTRAPRLSVLASCLCLLVGLPRPALAGSGLRTALAGVVGRLGIGSRPSTSIAKSAPIPVQPSALSTSPSSHSIKGQRATPAALGSRGRLEEINRRTGGAIDKLRQRHVGLHDLNVKYPWTKGNKIEPLSDGKRIWPSMLRDIKNATSTVHINMFGMTADNRGWELAKLLQQRAQQGVKVVLVADKLGARQTGLWRLSGSRKDADKLFKFYKQVGKQTGNLDVVWYDRPRSIGRQLRETLTHPSVASVKDMAAELRGFVRLDHTKAMVIDGKTAYIGGMTLQKPNIEKKHDMHARVRGPFVQQLQSSFLLALKYNGGKVDARNADALLKKHFPALGASSGSSGQARLLRNIPGVEARATRAYIKQINSAKSTVEVLNPYITDHGILGALARAAKRGVQVKVTLPRDPESGWNTPISDALVSRLSGLKNVSVYRYNGPVHGKRILVDGQHRNGSTEVGSANMDSPSGHNYFEAALQSKGNRELNRKMGKIFAEDQRAPHASPQVKTQGPVAAAKKTLGYAMAGVDLFLKW